MKDPQFCQVSEIQIPYRNPIKLAQRPTITNSKDAESIFRANWSDDIFLPN